MQTHISEKWPQESLKKKKKEGGARVGLRSDKNNSEGAHSVEKPKGKLRIKRGRQ